MPRDIQLDGTETTIIKALGIGGSEIDGHTLLERCGDINFAELSSVIKGLIDVGFVDADSTSFHEEETFKKIHFRVNSGYSKELRDALDPTDEPRKSKRVRRE